MAGVILFGLMFAAGVLFDSEYSLSLLIVILLHAMPAIGLAILAGYAGQISLGHAAFYGLGAYGAAFLSARAGIPPWLGIAIATASVAVIGHAVGWIIFRVRGHHLAIATLGLGIVASVAFTELRQITGGPSGFSGIPSLQIFGWTMTTDRQFFIVAWTMAALAYWLATNLVHSPTGLQLRGLGESERAAVSLGTDVAGLKRAVLMLSAGLAALGGGLYAHYVGFISPQPFGPAFSIRLLLMVAVGGFQSLPGVVLGVAFITVVSEPLQQLGYFDVVVFGLLLILVMIWFPEGLFVSAVKFARRAWTRA